MENWAKSILSIYETSYSFIYEENRFYDWQKDQLSETKTMNAQDELPLNSQK